MIGFLLANWKGIALGALISAVPIAYVAGHSTGVDDGRAAEQAAARTRALELIEKRNRDNEEISSMDLAQLCAELGGRWVPDQNRCD